MDIRSWGSGPTGLSTDPFSISVMGKLGAKRVRRLRVAFELPTQRSGDLVRDRQDRSAVWPRCARKIPVGRGGWNQPREGFRLDQWGEPGTRRGGAGMKELEVKDQKRYSEGCCGAKTCDDLTPRRDSI